MDLGITGKKALVCGASAGMGKAIAEALAAEGALVFLCARNENTLKPLSTQIKEKYGLSAEYQSCDLADKNSRSQLIAAVKSKLGNIDILIHNTGGPKPSTAEETGEPAWESGFKSLFKSVIDLNQAFIPAMKQQRWGRIICVTSLSVLEPIASLAVLNAMRSAVTALLKTLADELASYEITVNCLAPGAISTGRITDLIETRAKSNNMSFDDYQTEYIKSIPAKRLGTTEEFAAAACFLASTQASYITGSTICVDGGRRRSTY